MTITTETASALIGTQRGVKIKQPKKKSGKYPQRTRPVKGPRRSR